MENTDIKYTLITGASEGLGKAIAIECAERKMNLVLVSLPGIELYHLSSYIRRRYAVRVCEYELDLSNEESRLLLYKNLREHNLRIDKLINNAGIGGTGCFEAGDYKKWEKQIQLNISAVVHLTYLFLPELKKNKQSYILNISSLCIFFFLPQKQVYGATKSFIYFFSKSLHGELKNENVSVTVLCPGAINTSPVLFFLNHDKSWLTRNACMDPQDVASIAIDGLLAGKERIIPGKWSRIFYFLDKVVPKKIKNRMIANKMKTINQEHAERLLFGNNKFLKIG